MYPSLSPYIYILYTSIYDEFDVLYTCFLFLQFQYQQTKKEKPRCPLDHTESAVFWPTLFYSTGNHREQSHNFPNYRLYLCA